MGVIGLSAMGYAFLPLSYPAISPSSHEEEERCSRLFKSDFHGWRRCELLAVGWMAGFSVRNRCLFVGGEDFRDFRVTA